MLLAFLTTLTFTLPTHDMAEQPLPPDTVLAGVVYNADTGWIECMVHGVPGQVVACDTTQGNFGSWYATARFTMGEQLESGPSDIAAKKRRFCGDACHQEI